MARPCSEELSWKLNNLVSFGERFTAFPNVSDLGQYRFQFDVTGATKLKAWLSWQVTVSDRYLSNPLPGLKSNDELLSTGLRLTFGKGALGLRLGRPGIHHRHGKIRE